MSKKTISTVRLVTGIVLATLAVLCAVSLAVACVRINQSADRPFTPESIAKAWSVVAIFVWSFAAAAIFAGVWSVLFPAPAKKQKGIIFPELRLAKIKARLARKQYSEELLLPLVKQEILVKSIRITSVAVCLLCSIYPLIYLHNLDNFTSIDAQLNAQVIRAVLPSLGFAAIALLYCLFARLMANASCEKAILYAKSIMLLPAPPAEKKPEGMQKKELPSYAIIVARAALIAAAVLMIILGIFNGGMNDVLQKAIRICTECIGLG